MSSYSKQIIWSSKLYDSLDNIPESEYIQYCGKQEVNRSGLKNFKFVTINCTASEYCLPSLSNNILFYDYKQYVLIQNHISNQFYCYYKKNNEFKTIKVDSNFVKKLYIDYLKNVKQYEVYNYMLNTDKTIKPKIPSIVPIDDCSVFACLRNFKI